MIKLTAQNKEQISKAVTEAEKSTSGEIAVVVAKQSSDYAVYELTFAVIIGLIFMILGLIFYSEIDTMIMNMIWSSSKIITTSVIGLGTFVVIILFYILANIPFIDRLIIPKSIKNEKVREKAQLSFMNYEVGKTRDRTGILIFISKLERRVEILADVGISAVYPHDSWQKQVDRIIAGIKNKQFSEELEKVILDLGQVLAKNFPIKDDNTNELPNKVRGI